MWEPQLGDHTVRSHGIRVARTHMHDWLILLLLGIILSGLNVIHPFYRFVGKDMMSDLKYPYNTELVPFWTVPLCSVMLPTIVFLFFYVRRKDVYDLHHAILGLLFSLLITGVITDAIKNAVGRPRPDFFWRCFPDGIDAYDRWGNVVCHGDEKVIRQGHKSFPSGHTSWAFAGMGFLSLYLSGKIRVFDRRGHVAKLCLVLVPLIAASFVAISRVDDYRHHWQDVFAGGLLALVVSTFCYLQFFPPPYHIHGWRTHTYLMMLEDFRRNANNAQYSGVEVEIEPNERRIEGANNAHNPRVDVEIERSNKAVSPGGSSSASTLPVEDVESGKRV